MKKAGLRAISGLRTFTGDIAAGFFEITHSGLALLGLAVAFAAVTLVARPDLREMGAQQLMGWLQAQQIAMDGFATEPFASERATASNPKDLPREQAAATYWLSKRYHVAPEPLAVLVSEAYAIGTRVKLDPMLILAVMAVESSFNPFAQSNVGAQGLMQVMTRVHTDKYEDFGGRFAAFDPVANLRVGVKVLQECIARAGGSVEGGLRAYVGAANLPDDTGYAGKVLAEQARLRQAVEAAAKPAVVATKARPDAGAPGQAPQVEKVALLTGGL